MWREKAHRIIGELCRESYLKANRGRKRHVPYSVPPDAEFLIDCLNRDDEVAAKAFFIERAILSL